MNNLLLAIDIGNTTIECGIFENDKLRTSWRLSSEISRSPDECWQSTAFFCREADLDEKKLTAVAVASVVPNLTRSFTGMAKTRLNLKPLVISVDSCPFLDVRYSNPRQVGADRLCNAYAGYHHYGGPLIVVDFGTSITFDVVAGDGAYLGGIIIPGPKTAAKVLHLRTAQLPQVLLSFPETVIGKSTDHAIQAGLTWGMVDMVDGMIDRISRELKGSPKVIATGGYAEPYAGRSRNFNRIHNDLVLEGIKLIYYRAMEDR